MKRTNPARNRAFKSLCLSLTCLSAVPLMAAPAAAQSDTAQKTYQFNIGGQSLSSALTAFAAETGLQIVYSQEDAGQISSPGVKGRMTADQALARITAETGYSFQYLRAGVVTLVKASAGGNDGEQVAGVVQVEGLQGSPYFGGAGQAAGVNGTNGSRDITATEGTGSFTSGALTIGSKVPQALKDVPQSISVLTDERLKQQNITNFNQAIAQVPGVTVIMAGAGGNASNQEGVYYSRGFRITSIQVDGGSPLSTSFNYFPQIDMAQYDHVELLRGANGLFTGYGDPSGTINLVRKKPLDHSQVSLEAQLGSWQNYRTVADLTSPLAFDGKLRGRMVLTWQDNHYFYDVAKDNRSTIYGVLDFDATPTTLVTVGASHAQQRSVPFQNGLPRYQNGDDLELPRSTAIAFPWNRFDLDTTEIFGSVEQKLGQDWTVKLNATYNRQHNTQKIGYSYYSVNPLNDLGPTLMGLYQNLASKQLSTEATISGSFQIFGQRQEIVAGIGRSYGDAGGQVTYASLIPRPYQPYPGGPIFCAPSWQGPCPDGAIPPNGPPIDVFNFDPGLPIYNEPPTTLPLSRNPFSGSTTLTAYTNLRLTAFDRLHLTTGIRWSRFEHRYSSESLCTSIPDTPTSNGYPNTCYGQEIGDPYGYAEQTWARNDISWPPAVNLSYDLTKALTVYAGYTDIYISQAQFIGGDLQPIQPITGSNWEVGAKWAPGDKLNVSIAAYRINQKGFAANDNTGRYDFSHPDYPNNIYYYIIADDGTPIPNGSIAPGVTCCWLSNPNNVQRSQGIDVEVAGEIRPGWQLSASYNYDETSYQGSYNASTAGLPFQSIQPKHLYKLWTSFDFGAAGSEGWLSGLTLSAGFNGRSKGFFSGYTCVNFLPPDPATGTSDCKSYTPEDYKPYQFTAEPYTVVSARIDYRFSNHWSLAVNLENIFDKTYYATVGSGVEGGNWYGNPRSYTATLRAKW